MINHAQGKLFQSLDWVDVDFDKKKLAFRDSRAMFQSLDWVDVDFDLLALPCSVSTNAFQSLDWVDVDFDVRRKLSGNG